MKGDTNDNPGSTDGSEQWQCLGNAVNGRLLRQGYGQGWDFSVKELRLALKWYERAAQTGDAYALEMTGAVHTIFAETYLQMGIYEDSLKEWTQVYRYTVPLIQYPGYPKEKRREISENTWYKLIPWQSLYKAAYCNILLERYADALGILEKMSLEPCSKEMMLKGICLFSAAETEQDYEMAYEILSDYESGAGVRCLSNAVDDTEEMILSEAFTSLSVFYRIGFAGARCDIEWARELLCRTLDIV